MNAQIFVAAFLGCLMALGVAYAITRLYVQIAIRRMIAVDPGKQRRMDEDAAALAQAFGPGSPNEAALRAWRGDVPDALAVRCDSCERQQTCPSTTDHAGNRAFLEHIGWKVGTATCPFCVRAGVGERSMTGAEIEPPMRRDA